MRNLYEILGVPQTAFAEEIKEAYKIKASKLHPDKHNGCEDKTEQFQELSAAYAVLSDEAKRERYDETGQTDGVTLEEEADALFATSLMRIAAKAGFVPGDYIKATIIYLQNTLRECHKSKVDCENTITRLDYLCDHSTTAEHSALRAAIGEAVAEQEMRLQHANKGITLLAKALELADGYEYTGELPQQRGVTLSYVEPYIT